MPLDEDIIAFKKWANQIGVPANNLPSDDALKSVLKSRQGGDIMLNLMKRVRPSNQTRKARLNNLLSKAEQLDQQFASCTSQTLARSFLPKEMQRYYEMEKLKKTKEKSESKITELRSSYDSIMSSVRNKNLYKIQLQHKLENMNAKTNILEVKTDSLVDSIEKEEANRERMVAVMPVKMKTSNSSESTATDAMKQAMGVLRDFYDSHHNDFKVHDSECDIWAKVRRILADIPNWVLWNVILKANENLSQQIIALTKENCSETSSVPEQFSPFELEILKARTAFFNIIQKYAAEKQESTKYSENFPVVHERFVTALQLQLSDYAAGNKALEDIMSDYIVKINTQSFSKGQVEYLKKEINSRKAQLANGKQKTEDHQMLLNTTRQIYDEISSLANRIFQEISSLGEIKPKITYSKKILQCMLKAARSNKKKLIKTGNITDSFEMSDVLCSTKMDLESSIANTTLRSETSVMKNKVNQVARHVDELLIFIDLPMDNLRYSTKNCFFYIHRNPLITNTSESPLVLQLIPNYLSTPYGSIEEMKIWLKWNSILQKHAVDRKSNIVVPEASLSTLKACAAAKGEEIVELLDQIKTTGIRTNQKLRKLSKCYKFILNNTLHSFVPQSKLFNNRAYADYYAEFLMYYRMLKKDEPESK